jgi:type IV pilus assembly protein PilY1
MHWLFRWIALVVFAGWSMAVLASPRVELASTPLFAAASVDKPAMVLALSVEFPTVGAQYVKSPGQAYDDSYTHTKEYLGYYDAESCYAYNDNPTEQVAAGKSRDDYKRFDRIGAASNRQCEDAFSGNFLNWASSSAIDMLRLSLTGGDRYIDTPASGTAGNPDFVPALTILQRAVIPNGNPICMWGSSYFPLKQLRRGTDGQYSKAVPKIMRNQAWAGRGGLLSLWRDGDLWVANSQNKIYFGTDTSSGNDCSGFFNSLINIFLNGYVVGSADPSDATFCAWEGANSNCVVTGNKIVWYGDGDYWVYRYVSNQTIKCNNSTFGDPRPYYVKQCRIEDANKVLAGSGFFYSRVQVCNANNQGELQDERDYALCKKYPNGSLKPVGAVQKYSEQVRLAAFGYLLDQTTSRYGGVLRAPMKYVGEKVFDARGAFAGTNPRQEWNSETGVFVDNPDGDTRFNISGVVNYLNKFGRTGTPGVYKQYDPVGELHYEALRYLQGLPPTPAAISNINDTMRDGFPVYTEWLDPYQGRDSNADYSCLKSNIVVIADTGTHDQNRLPSPNISQNVPDINAWRTVVQDFERNRSRSYIDGSGVSRTTSNPNGSAGSVPTGTNRSQIMGSAYWARTQDIRGRAWTASPSKQMPGLRVKTFIFDVNERGEQTDFNKRRTDQLYLAAKYGGFETDPANLEQNFYNTWGNPFRHEDGTVKNQVWDLNNDGDPNTYFLQSDARGVLSAFDEIFKMAATASRSIAGSAMPSQSLTQEGSLIYQASFDTSDWSGDVLATELKLDSNNRVTLATTPRWSAATQLNAMQSPAANRNIVIGSGGSVVEGAVATLFSWNKINETLQTNLNRPFASATSDNRGQARLQYLRGERSREGQWFRLRTRLLGDVINSGVVYAGAPTTQISGVQYAAFYNQYKTRKPVVYVGANDGMLHAFDAETGNEVFAYIPSWLGPKLSALTDPAYAQMHQSYVDATPTVAEAEVRAGEWKTVLVSGTGAGGRGVFALDVSDPEQFAPGKVMWEFTEQNDTDMGFVVGRPRILKMEVDKGIFKWFAVVGSGVNNNSGRAALFILDLSKQPSEAWAENKNYYKLLFPVVDSTLGSTLANGLLNFEAVLDSNKQVRFLFMGDLHGNLWKLSFVNQYPEAWKLHNLSFFLKGNRVPLTPYPMYVAKDDNGKVQPITVAPSVGYGSKLGTYHVFFGTGKYLENADLSSTVQSAYMIYDNGSANAEENTSPIVSAISGRLRLQKGTVQASGNVVIPAFIAGRAKRNLNRTASNPEASGWYFDFPVARERQITAASVIQNRVFFGTLIPAASGDAAGCKVSGGTGKQYTVDFATGQGESMESSVGVLGETLSVEVSPARKYSQRDSTGKTIRKITMQTLQQGSDGVAPGESVEFQSPAGRLSWRQIHNYHELRKP